MRSQLKAVIFDWAGTMMDFGSRAPVLALGELFAQAGVPISEEEARADMGMAKRDHIRALLQESRIAEAWRKRHGAMPTEADADALFARSAALMRVAALECATLVPGAAEIACSLQRAGIAVGSCTGYTREMMREILPRAAAQGYRPDYVVCAGETPQGRPSPLMVWKNLVELGVWPAAACVKVDDAEVGIAEGLAAGVLTVGVAASGNALGLSREALERLSQSERTARIDAARQKLLGAGAHAVIDTVAELPSALAKLSVTIPADLTDCAVGSQVSGQLS